MAVALAGIFFLSGAASLIFEALWFRQAGLALGNSVWAASIVLASFMAGIAIGNAIVARVGGRFHRPLLVYAAAEGILAFTGVGVTLFLPYLGVLFAPLLGASSESPLLLHGARLAIAFSCLMLPASAMGLTLPLLTRALSPHLSSFGQSLGLLYGFNTLGAALGVVAAEAWLITWFGVRGTAWLAGGMAAVAGLLAAVAQRRWRFEAASHERPEALQANPWPLLFSAFACGFALLALEVIWVRFLALFVPSSALIFSLVLAVVLAGIAAGSLLASFWLTRDAKASVLLPAIAWLAGLACVLGYGLFDSRAEIDRWLAWAPPFDATLGITGLFALRLCFPAALLSGAIFALQGSALHEALGAGAARSAGLLTLANTTGALIGAAVAGLVALPTLGIERSIFAIAAIYAVAGASMLRAGAWKRLRGAASALAAAGLSAAIVLFPFGLLSDRFLPEALGSHFERDHEQLVELRETRGGVLRLLRRDFLGEPLYYRLLTDGMSMTGNDWRARRYMTLFVTLPVALHPDLRSALVIGHGIGSTTRALTANSSFDEIVVVDPSKDTLGLSRTVFADSSTDPLADPRVRVRIEDGRFFLQSTQQRFDLITGEPPPPKAPGIVSLYTREHFQLMRDHLEPGGMVTYWLPYASLDADDGKAILAAFLEVFPDMTLWYGWNLDLIMLGTKGPSPGAPSIEHFGRQWRDPVTQPELAALGIEQPAQLAAMFLADAAYLSDALAGVAPLTDDRPHRLSPRVVDAQSADLAVAAWLGEQRTWPLFERSEWIASRFPPELSESSQDWFADQNLQRWASSQPALGGMPELEQLHEVMEETQLHAPISWLLDSDLDRQRIAARNEAQPEAAYHLGVRALAERRYGDAAAQLARAERAEPRRQELKQLRAYALCRTGSRREANEVLRTARTLPGFDSSAWLWLTRTCSLLAD